MRSKIAHVLGATIIFGTGSGKTCDLDRIARQAHIPVSTVGNLGAVQTSALAREVFDRETKGLEPDTKLPDLILPGRPATGAPSRKAWSSSPAAPW